KQLRSNIFELGCHAFADRFPVDREFARPVVGPTDVDASQKVKGFRLPFPTLLPVLGARIQSGAFSPGAAPAQISPAFPATAPGIAPRPPGAGTPTRHHPHSAR